MFVEQLAVLFGALISLAGLFRVIDRFVDGRLRRRLRHYLGNEDLREQVESNGEKLDRLHTDHMTTMGAQVAIAERQEEWTSLLAEELEIAEARRPDPLAVEDLRRRAHARGADFPGDFYRGHVTESDD